MIPPNDQREIEKALKRGEFDRADRLMRIQEWNISGRLGNPILQGAEDGAKADRALQTFPKGRWTR